MASAHATSSRLLALPDSLLGLIFEELEDGEDRRAFMHTCKHLHDNQECLNKITSVTLFLDKSEHGTVHRQLSTVIPGSAITDMVICGFERSAMCVEQRITFRSPAALPLLAAFSRSEHQQLLHQITHLELDEMCAIKDAPNIRAFVHCLRDCMPNLKHLTVGSVANEHATFLLSELPQLQLITLNLAVAADDLSGPGTGHLSPSDCFFLGQLQTLQHLMIECEVCECDFAPFANLSGLQSFCIASTWGDDEGKVAGTLGLNTFLAHVPSLTLLSFPCLPGSEVPSSQSVHHVCLELCDMIDLPTRATLPALLHLECTNLNLDPGKPQEKQLECTLDGLTGVNLNCENFWLTSDDMRCPCAGFLHALLSRGFIFKSVEYLECSNIYFRPGDLRQLAACFPNLEELLMQECCFVPSNVIAEICDFSMLHSCIIRGLDEIPDVEELDDAVEEDACSFGNFCQGLEDACVAIQARRCSSLPPLQIELINFTDTYLREHLFDTMENLDAKLHDVSQRKVWLSWRDYGDGSSDYYGDYGSDSLDSYSDHGNDSSDSYSDLGNDWSDYQVAVRFSLLPLSEIVAHAESAVPLTGLRGERVFSFFLLRFV